MPSGIISTGNFPKLLWPGLNAVWGDTYARFPQQWSELFMTESSDKNYEEDVEIVGLGLAPVKNQGQAVNYDSMAQGFISRYVHVAYGLGFIVTKEEIDDNLYMKFGTQRTMALANSMNQTKENIGADIFNLGFTSQLSGDGVSIFNSAHPTAAGNQSNVLTPSADLSEAALESLLIQIRDARDSRGLRINLNARKLAIPAALEYQAERILGDPDRPGTADRDINAMYQLGKFPEGFVINNYLTDTDAFFVLTDCQNGFKHYNRVAIDFTQDNDFDTENAKFKAYERYSFGVSNWRQGFASAGA